MTPFLFNSWNKKEEEKNKTSSTIYVCKIFMFHIIKDPVHFVLMSFFIIRFIFTALEIGIYVFINVQEHLSFTHSFYLAHYDADICTYFTRRSLLAICASFIFNTLNISPCINFPWFYNNATIIVDVIMCTVMSWHFFDMFVYCVMYAPHITYMSLDMFPFYILGLMIKTAAVVCNLWENGF